MSVDPRFAALLLDWYRLNARQLPWRTPPGGPLPDPYRVWLSEIMLQQTTVAAVAPYFARFVTRWPTVADLAAADDAEVMTAWAGLGYYARARNLLATARRLAAHGFPPDEAGWRALPGIGAYTAAAIAAIALGQRAVVVDGNVERVVARLFAVETPLPAARRELRALTDRITPEPDAGDFAQALMDLGSTICTPRAPACLACPLQSLCAAARSGDPASYPRRPAKPDRPERYATALWHERDDHLLLVRRPPTGLLGGMRALPLLAEPAADAPRPLNPLASVQHVFTHFRLTLDVVAAPCQVAPDAEWWPLDCLAEAGLPTVFRKAATAAMKGKQDVRRAA